MKPVRIAVIGVGAWGRNHARVLASTAEAELIGFYDVDPERAEDAASRWGGRAFPDLGMLLAETEAVCVAVPTIAHREVGVRALAAGAHVLVEKPIAPTPEDAREMAAAARSAGRLLAVGHLERFNPAVEALLAEGCAPRFVEVHRLSAFDVRGLDVSVVLDLMIHDIDILLRLTRSPLVDLDATGVAVLSPNIDIANARLRFGSGCVANLTASRISLAKTRKIRIFEETRYISLDYTEQAATVYRRVGELPPPERLTQESFGRLIEKRILPIEKGEPLRIEIQHFLRAVRGERGRYVTAEEGVEALRVAHVILRKIRDGHRTVE